MTTLELLASGFPKDWTPMSIDRPEACALSIIGLVEADKHCMQLFAVNNSELRTLMAR
jgi:hypothetical protein